MCHPKLSSLLFLVILYENSAVTTITLDAINPSSPNDLVLDYDFAVDLASLPLECYHKEYPYKDSVVLESKEDLQL